MKTKYLLIMGALWLSFTATLQAQIMRWIPSPSTGQYGKCSDQSTKSGLTQCYVLEYTPAVSGVLTSYTTGFMVSCTSLGTAIAKNQCCSMTEKNNEINACSTVGKVLLNSSGNSGTITHNQIEAGVPVILHQVCLTIPTGEAVSIEEEPVTDLTTSVDVGNGSYVTEFPSFETVTFRRFRYDDAVHTAFLDFQARKAGERRSQLDWSTPGGPEAFTFIIEHSTDGEHFQPIGEHKGVADDIRISSYQFFDDHAVTGSNYYRLRQLDASGSEAVSPVRELFFAEKPMEVSASPNPARERLYVHVIHANEPGQAMLIDVSGKERMTYDFDASSSNLILDLQLLEQGIYTLQVKSGKETHTEKIVVMR